MGVIRVSYRVLGLLLVWTACAEAQAPSAAAGPRIRAAVSPDPNAAGWNNTPVTVTFVCSPSVTTCHPPVTFEADGARQGLTVSVHDDAGTVATTTVVVNIDKTPAVVGLTAPREGLTTTAATLEVLGSAGDALSGLKRVTCNGQSGTVVIGNVRCVVPLQPGVNAVMLNAMDAAGNSASAAVRVLREVPRGALSTFPTTMTAGVGQEFGIMIASGSGPKIDGARWASSDPDIVSISSIEGCWAILTARAPGQVTVRAVVNGRSAAATVTVVEATEGCCEDLPIGTVRWAVSPIPGLVPHVPLRAQRVDDTGPDLFAIDSDAPGRSAVMRALRSDGTEVWTGSAPGMPLAGDMFGGILVRLGASGNAIGRFDQLKGAPVWRFESQGTIGDGDQTDDGTLYLVEQVPTTASGRGRGDTQGFIVILDGKTALVKTRVPLPASTSHVAGCSG